MATLWFRFLAFWRFYWSAVTRYQLHSPFVFELAEAVLDRTRWYYAFHDVEELRARMLASDVVLQVTDHGRTPPRQSTRSVRSIVRRAASPPCQGQQLFRLANWAQPRTMLELGSSVGVGTAYLAMGARDARFVTLEGCAETAHVARTNLEWLGLKNAEVRVGPFEETLAGALQDLQMLDFVYVDGNHRPAPTLQYFEACLPHAHARTVFVFDDAHWSAGMEEAWRAIQAHPRVTLTLDFFDLSLAFVNPEFRARQHLCVVPAWWKPWRFF